MNLVDQYIRTHLFHFNKGANSLFKDIVGLIISEVNDKHILILRYLHMLLDESFLDNRIRPHVLHVHFAQELDDNSLLVISQYVLIRFYLEAKNSSKLSDNNQALKLFKSKLNSKLTRLMTCPDDASGKNGGNKIYKNWVSARENTKGLIDFYGGVSDYLEFSPKTIFNCPVRVSQRLNELFLSKPYACRIEDYKSCLTFNLLNTKLSVNEIDQVDSSIVDSLETVILFDCERKKPMQYFSLKEIKDVGVELRNYLVFSFGNKNNSVQNIRDKLTLIQDRFKIPEGGSYSVLPSEISYILNRESKKYIPITFFGISDSRFWEMFILETNIHDLYELRSIKMMNLYSFCYNQDVKNLIINDLFVQSDVSSFVSDETKQSILNLREDDLLSLRTCLENVLDLIVTSGIQDIVFTNLKDGTIIVVDEFILGHDKLKQVLLSVLGLVDSNNLASWSTLNKIKNGNVIILSYQDQGRYSYSFYPNLIETTFSKELDIKAIFLTFLFSTRYNWAKYNLARDVFKVANHPIRQKYFRWDRLGNAINRLRPKRPAEINWDLEQHYSSAINRETVKLRLEKEREKTYNISELFIYSIDGKSTFRVDKIGNIIELLDEVEVCYLHSLDEIQRNINLYAKIVDTSSHEEELRIIRKQYCVDDTEPGRLWKVLLYQKALETSEELLYEDLKSHLESTGSKIVSFSHFENNWLRPQSESIAPLSKKVFLALCNFLGLPRTYYVLIQGIRNVSKQSIRQSTQRMNRLLNDLFNDGCFDERIEIREQIISNLDKYKRKHPIEELGIDEHNLGDKLVDLVQLIKTEVALRKLERFEKIE